MDVVEAYAYLLEEGRPTRLTHLFGRTWTVREAAEDALPGRGRNLRLTEVADRGQ